MYMPFCPSLQLVFLWVIPVQQLGEDSSLQRMLKFLCHAESTYWSFYTRKLQAICSSGGSTWRDGVCYESIGWLNSLTCLSLLMWYQTFIWMYYRSGSISRGFRGEFRQWQIIPGICEGSPVMANQFSVKFYPLSYLIVL